MMREVVDGRRAAVTDGLRSGELGVIAVEEKPFVVVPVEVMADGVRAEKADLGVGEEERWPLLVAAVGRSFGSMLGESVKHGRDVGWNLLVDCSFCC